MYPSVPLHVSSLRSSLFPLPALPGPGMVCSGPRRMATWSLDVSETESETESEETAVRTVCLHSQITATGEERLLIRMYQLLLFLNCNFLYLFRSFSFSLFCISCLFAFFLHFFFFITWKFLRAFRDADVCKWVVTSCCTAVACCVFELWQLLSCYCWLLVWWLTWSLIMSPGGLTWPYLALPGLLICSRVTRPLLHYFVMNYQILLS